LETNIAVFRGKEIRKTIHKNEWWFSVVDVIEALTGSERPRKYWSDLKNKLSEEGYSELSEKIGQLKLQATDGKYYETDCANTETMFRIIQSIPSPKAEPFKRWLAKVGYERVQEIEDPELATKRTRALYKQKREYEILTAEIAKAAFGITPGQHKKFKGLKRENLRDHMTDLELIFSMLGEAATTEIARTDDARGFDENKKSARKGGEVAGKARTDLEQKTGKRVVTRENYLTISQGHKKLGKK
jgi:prophage antirepressor-like protein